MIGSMYRDAIFYVKTYFSLWIAQVCLKYLEMTLEKFLLIIFIFKIFCAILCYTQTLLMTYLAYKVSIDIILNLTIFNIKTTGLGKYYSKHYTY